MELANQPSLKRWHLGPFVVGICLVAACTTLPPVPIDGKCGNGVVEPGEQCDPGRLQASSELCNAACQLTCVTAEAGARACPADSGLACVATTDDGHGFCAAPSGVFLPYELLSSDAEFEVANVIGDFRDELVLFDNNSIEIRSDIRFVENSTTTLTSRDETFVSPIGQVVVANVNGDKYADILVASSSGLHVFSAQAGDEENGNASSLTPTSFAFSPLATEVPVVAVNSVGDVPSRQLYQFRFGDTQLAVSTVPAPGELAINASVATNALNKPVCFGTRTAKLYASGPGDVEEDFAFSLLRQTLAENPTCTAENVDGGSTPAERTIFLVNREGLSHTVEWRTLAPIRLSGGISPVSGLRITSAPASYEIDATASGFLAGECSAWLGVTSIEYNATGPWRLGLATVSLVGLREDVEKACAVDANGVTPGGEQNDLFRELQNEQGGPFCDSVDSCVFDDVEITYLGGCPTTRLPRLRVLALRGNELFRFESGAGCGSPDLRQTGRASLGSGVWDKKVARDINNDGIRDYLGAVAGDDDVEVMRSNPTMPGTFVYSAVDTTGIVEDFVTGDFDGDGGEDLAYVEIAADGLSRDVFAIYGDGAGWGDRQFLARFAEVVSIDAAALGITPTGGLPEGAAELVVAGRRDTGDANSSIYIFQGGATRFMSSPVLITSAVTTGPDPKPFKVRPVTRAVVGNFVGLDGENASVPDILLISREASQTTKVYIAAGTGVGKVAPAVPISLANNDLGDFGVGTAHWTVAAGEERDTLVGIDAERENASQEVANEHQDVVQMSFNLSEDGYDVAQQNAYATDAYYGIPVRLAAAAFNGEFAGVVGTFLQSQTNMSPVYRLVWWGASLLSESEDNAKVVGSSAIEPCFDAVAIDLDGQLPMDLAVVCQLGVYAYIGGVETDHVTLLESPEVFFDPRSRMRPGDVDGNGVADLVVVDATKRVWVLLQKTSTELEGACASGELEGSPCAR